MRLKPIPHEERHITSFPGSQYLLPSDGAEKTRLDTQHNVLTRIFGNRLTLSPVELKPGDKVLDSGSGACSWLLDFASRVPRSVRIIGTDIEPGLFPTTLPENVTMEIASVLNLPKEWTNEFQLVHQRLLIGSLVKEEWPTAIQELFRVTKPNGWIELCEVGNILVSPNPLIPTHKAIQNLVHVYEATNHEYYITQLFPQLLRDAGFTDVKTVEACLPLGKWAGKDGEDGCKARIGFMKALKTSVLKRGGLGFVQTENEYDEIVDDFERICGETPGTLTKYHTVYARKPL